jgi:hypothetical protein
MIKQTISFTYEATPDYVKILLGLRKFLFFWTCTGSSWLREWTGGRHL